MRNPRTSANIIDLTGEFPLEPSAYLFYLLFQAGRQRDLHYDRKLATIGLSLHRWRILAVIRRIENCSMKDLALFGAMDRTTLTRAVDQLVAQGLVERWFSPRDRRRVNVVLSPEGEAIFGRATAVLLEGNAAMLAGIEDESVRTAARVLRDVIRNLVDDSLTAEKLLAYSQPAAGRK